MRAIVAGGHTFSIHCDLIDMTMLNRPDETWVYVDPTEHEHCWLFKVDGETVSREVFIQMAKDAGLPTDQL